MLSDWFVASVRVLRRAGFAGPGLLCLLAGCSAAGPPPAQVCRCEVVNTFPHDTKAFTQGLAYGDGEPGTVVAVERLGYRAGETIVRPVGVRLARSPAAGSTSMPSDKE